VVAPGSDVVNAHLHHDWGSYLKCKRLDMASFSQEHLPAREWPQQLHNWRASVVQMLAGLAAALTALTFVCTPCPHTRAADEAAVLALPGWGPRPLPPVLASAAPASPATLDSDSQMVRFLTLSRGGADMPASSPMKAGLAFSQPLQHRFLLQCAHLAERGEITVSEYFALGSRMSVAISDHYQKVTTA